MKLGREVGERDPFAADFEHMRGLRMRGVFLLSLFGLPAWAGIAAAVVAVCR